MPCSFTHVKFMHNYGYVNVSDLNCHMASTLNKVDHVPGYVKYFTGQMSLIIQFDHKEFFILNNVFVFNDS